MLHKNKIQNKKKYIIASGIVLLVILIGIILMYRHTRYTPYIPKETPKIFLYGEGHGDSDLLQKEYELWKDYYDKNGMRYLFIELPYYTAQYLNIWMKEEDDQILNELYDDLEGTMSHVPEVKEFYQKIKENCPETIFVGTDVGHQYYSTGERYLEELRESGKEDSEEYNMTVKNMEQGKKYYEEDDDVYRENAMTENFIAAYDQISGTAIMGIYGDAHTDPRKKNFTNEADCMAKQLKKYYGDIIQYDKVAELLK